MGDEVYFCGIDPGRSAAVGLIKCLPSGDRELVDVWSIYGSDRPRWDRVIECITDIKRLTADGCLSVAIETPAGGGASSRHFYGWQVSVGRDIGRWESMMHIELPSASVVMIPANTWPRLCGVRCGKALDGTHRIQESRRLLMGGMLIGDGMADDTKAGRERRVARSEAALIALAHSKQ
jgi:hypothetical protein